MNKIEVGVLETHGDPGAWTLFLAKLTQRGHKITSLEDVKHLYQTSIGVNGNVIKNIAAMPHGTIKRFTPITVAIVGASRRFLAQIRTHQVGLTYVSASLQYSNYDGVADFTVPYEIAEAQRRWLDGEAMSGAAPIAYFYESCRRSMEHYSFIVSNEGYNLSNDTAGYVAPQAMRNALIISGNHQAWSYLFWLRGCNRNTVETQYVIMRIWEELLNTPYGEEYFRNCGPNCLHGKCLEGKMSCGKSLGYIDSEEIVNVPRRIIDDKWPLLKDEECWRFV